MRTRSLLVASAALLLLSCGGVVDAPPEKTPTPVMKLAEGPARSGTDIRQVWIQTDGGGRVRFQDTVYASVLSDRFKTPIYCAFGRAGRDGRSACIPNYQSSLSWDAGAGLYSDANCVTPVAVEQANYRGCIGGKTLFVVTTFQTADGCSQLPLVSEAKEVVITTAYGRSLGTCRPIAIDPTARFYVMGASVDEQLPRGTVGIE